MTLLAVWDRTTTPECRTHLTLTVLDFDLTSWLYLRLYLSLTLSVWQEGTVLAVILHQIIFSPLTFPHLFFILTCNLLFHHWMGRWSGWNVCLADLPMGVMPRMPRNRKEVLEIDKNSSENGNYQIKENVKCFFFFKPRLWRDLSLKCFLWK